MQISGWCPQEDCSCFRPASELFFCPTCRQVCCENCTQSFACLYFCPQCLFEIPNGMAAMNRYCCPRNCFYCTFCDAPANSCKEDMKLSCPNCKITGNIIQESDPAFVELQKAFHLASISNTVCHVEPAFEPWQMKVSFERKRLAVRVGYSCNKCNDILSSTKMNGASFTFPTCQLILKSLLGMTPFEDASNNSWIEFENRTKGKIIFHASENEIGMDSITAHQTFYEIESVLSGKEQNFIQLDNMLWYKTSTQEFDVHIKEFDCSLSFRIDLPTNEHFESEI